MAYDHTVKEGDHIVRLAYEAGHAAVDGVWMHPANESLRQQRSDPGVLALGDTVHVPDPPPRVFERLSTRRQHQLVVNLPQPHLRLVLLRATGTPYAGLECRVTFDDEALFLEIDVDGAIEFDIGPSTKTVSLSYGLEDMEIHIAHLQPVDTIPGWHARLVNLGYRPGAIDGEDSLDPRALRSAIEEFQCDERIEVDGVIGDETMKALVRAHGA